MYAYRRHMALVLTLIALAAVVLFALGLVLCIDWGGAALRHGTSASRRSLVQAPRNSVLTRTCRTRP